MAAVQNLKKQLSSMLLQSVEWTYLLYYLYISASVQKLLNVISDSGIVPVIEITLCFHWFQASIWHYLEKWYKM